MSHYAQKKNETLALISQKMLSLHLEKFNI